MKQVERTERAFQPKMERWDMSKTRADRINANHSRIMQRDRGKREKAEGEKDKAEQGDIGLESGYREREGERTSERKRERKREKESERENE